MVFFCSDLDETLDLDDSIVWRTSFYASSRKPNEHAMPAWSEDFIRKYCDGNIQARSKKGKPTIGFCGFAPEKPQPAPMGVMKRLKRFVKGGGNPPGSAQKAKDGTIRMEAIRAVRKSPRHATANIILRDRFWGGSVSPTGEPDLQAMQNVRKEYLQNLIDSDYVICARGAGNFSYRLYETLSCGRIPVFIDTDCVLPFESAIDWKQYCVWVDESDVANLPERVADFHARLSPGDFVDRQHACRELWEQWLSPTGFFSNLYRVLD
jgi:hypothetical protein